jgi:hypothetical protein
VSSYDARFERELKKRIAQELERLRNDLEVGIAVTDHAKYQNYVGRIAALKRVTNEFCPEIQTIIDQG